MTAIPVTSAVDARGVTHWLVTSTFTWRSEITWRAGGTLCQGQLLAVNSAPRVVGCPSCKKYRRWIEGSSGITTKQDP